ncbi:hypothetical protein ACRS7F_24030 [Brucella anthropi]|uniref:hypothetical protein n=1 Tax=Brucella anthropi TaxID=529 RepID=UPI00174693B4|nr:hypothetical protein HGK82_23185 [Ochrobactrum sp. MT180101]
MNLPLDGLGLLAGKRVLVLEHKLLLTHEAGRLLKLAGAEVVGPIASPDAARDLLNEQKIDGVIIDVRLSVDSVLAIIDDLDSYSIPFVFAANDNVQAFGDHYPGFILSNDPKKLSDIAKALFAPMQLIH